MVIFFLLSPYGLAKSAHDTRHFESLTTKHGLSQQHILCMLQDKDGFIWIGTYNGLNRFDGYEFKTFLSEENNPNSLSINVVFSMLEASDGRLWLGTWGIDIYDKATGQFERIAAGNDPDQISHGQINKIQEDNQGNFWLGTNGGGLNKYLPETKQLKYYTEANNLHSNIIKDLAFDGEKHLWIATDGGGISKLDITTDKIKTYRKSEYTTLKSDKITAVYHDGEKLWLGDNQGNLYLHDTVNNRFIIKKYFSHKFQVSAQPPINTIYNKGNSKFYIGTNGSGLFSFTTNNNGFNHFISQGHKPYTILSNEVKSLLIDKSDRLFVGTYGNGISYYSHYKHKFDVFQVHMEDIQEPEVNHFTDALIDKNGNLVACNYNGFLVIDTSTWDYNHYLPTDNYTGNKLLTIAMAPDGELWFGTANGIHRYSSNYKKVASYSLFPEFNNHSVYALEFDSLENLWVGTFSNGVARIAKEEWKNNKHKITHFEQYLSIAGDTNSLTENQIWSIRYVPLHGLYIGTLNGLNRYNYQSNNFHRITFNAAVKTFDIDGFGNFWIGTTGDGLIKYEPENNSKKIFTTSDGLSNNFVYGVLADKHNRIWVSTEYGMSVYNPHTEKFRVYDMSDGLPHEKFDDNSAAKLGAEKFYMGTSNGFITFNPTDILTDTCHYRIKLTGLRINNKPVNHAPTVINNSNVTRPVHAIESLLLESKQKDISFTFAGINVPQPYKVRYLYKLEGYDNNWIETDAYNRIARYTNLDGGRYTFKVRVINSENQLNKHEFKLSIVKKQYFYFSWWFITIVALLIASVIYLLFKWKIYIEINKKKQLETVIVERTKEIRNKNRELEKRAHDLHRLNIQLSERKYYIEKQKEEILRQKNALAESNNTKDRLFSIIAHDLRSPFNVLLGLSQLLLDKFKDLTDSNKLVYLKTLNETAETTLGVLDNLLHWSRGQSGRIVFSPQRLSLSKILDNAIKEAKNVASRKNISFIKTMENPNILVYCDINMIQIILRNILGNAIKFSMQNSSITLNAALADDDKVLISASDNGVGMTQEQLDSLFTDQHTGSSKGTEGERGTGIGLSLTKDLIAIHNEKIWAESIINRGTTIYFTLTVTP